MKIWFFNFLIIVGIVVLYYTGVFKLVANDGFKIFSYLLVIIMFVIGFFVIGNPFDGKKK